MQKAEPKNSTTIPHHNTQLHNTKTETNQKELEKNIYILEHIYIYMHV